MDREDVRVSIQKAGLRMNVAIASCFAYAFSVQQRLSRLAQEYRKTSFITINDL
jgi:hypothetical protein